MIRGIFGLLFATSLLSATPAFAIFNVQVLGGNRNAEFDGGSSSDKVKADGSELRFAAHVDPIPLVPIGFGLAFAQTTLEDGDTKIDGTDIDLEVEAWLPLEVAGLVPFAKLGYTVGGEYEVKDDTLSGFSAKYKPSGVSLHAGIKYEFLMRLGVMAEIEYGTRKLAFDKVSGLPAGVSFESDDVDQTSTSILIGAQAGI